MSQPKNDPDDDAKSSSGAKNMYHADKYQPQQIELKWQAYWAQHETFKATRRPGRKKAYILDMFPYPSGAGLHVGHPEGYTATDIVARYKRMNGVDVLHPMGWDAFGLPAEQYALKTGTHPRATTLHNIETFRRQLKRLGFSYDWSREVDTTDLKYVKWTQWIFLQLFKRGLAYQDKIPVNWCPALGTVLANEEVIDGKSERGDHPVERVPIRQWMLRITDYADRLDQDLDRWGLDWPETKDKQRNWIGRSEGALVTFKVVSDEGDVCGSVSVFTTRVDTLPGATYVVLAPEHELSLKVASFTKKKDVENYVHYAKNKSDRDRQDLSKEKTGVDTGAFVINPINGDKLPLWIADYVIGSYGTGAVMAVPAHDERDHAFALKFGLNITQVVAKKELLPLPVEQKPFVEYGVSYKLRSFCPIEDGTPTEQVKKEIVTYLSAKGEAELKINYRLRDWVFSRQRYWGEPIPIYFPVECSEDPRQKGAEVTVRYDKPIALDESELPLKLPELDDFKPGDDPAGPLARAKEWRFFKKDGQWFARETNTMPQWAGSCWYYLRFTDPANDDAPWSEQAYEDWMPVDLYVGGAEHAVLHLLYARFWHKVLFDIGVLKHPEPFLKLVHQGMILGEDNQKMSKARGNVINPDDVIGSHGADSLRVYEMFMGPLEATKPWQTNGVEGVRRFLDRVYQVCTSSGDPTAMYDLQTKRLVHKTVAKVTSDIESLKFNTGVSALMILTRHLFGLPKVPSEAAKTLVLLLSPFAPHLAEEMWQRLGEKESLAYAPWPSYDESLIVDDEVEIGVQVNGKLRGTIRIHKFAKADEAEAAARKEARVTAHLAGKKLEKFVYVAGKIVNFIVR